MVTFEPGFEITPHGISFIARVNGNLVGCWVDSGALAEKEGLHHPDSVKLRTVFKKHEAAIKDQITRKIYAGAAEPDRTFRLRSGEF
jgi:Protein of unknown function (DUF1488)